MYEITFFRRWDVILKISYFQLQYICACLELEIVLVSWKFKFPTHCSFVFASSYENCLLIQVINNNKLVVLLATTSHFMHFKLRINVNNWIEICMKYTWLIPKLHQNNVVQMLLGISYCFLVYIVETYFTISALVQDSCKWAAIQSFSEKKNYWKISKILSKSHEVWYHF